MSLRVEIETDNAAFDPPHRSAELARIMRTIAARIEAGETRGVVWDVNGNNVGDWEFDPE